MERARVTPLMKAAMLGNPKPLKKELEKPGVDLEACDSTDRTALMYAVQFQYPDSVRELLISGADPDHRTSQGKPIDLSGSPDIKRMLREASEAKALGQKWNGSSLNRKESTAGTRFSRPCRYFLQGICRYGDSCWYKHVNPSIPVQTASCSASSSSSSATDLPKAKANPVSVAEQGFRYCDDAFVSPLDERYKAGSEDDDSDIEENVEDDSDFEDEEEDSDEDSETEQRMRNCGFTDEEAWELACQGVKPWDDDAWDVLAALGY